MSFYSRNACTTRQQSPVTPSPALCGQGGPSPCGVMLSTAAEERNQMTALNDKLSSYITKVRELRSQKHENPAGYHEAIRVLEEEIMKLKGMYEDELARLRALLGEANQEKAALSSQLNQLNMTIDGQQTKVNEECNRARSLADELDRVNKCLAEAQKEIADLRACLNSKDAQLQEASPELQRLRRENEDLKNKLGCQTNLRLKAEECAKSCLDKRKFDEKSRDQNIRDLEERLKASNDIIMNLERKICQLTPTDHTDIPGLLQKLRDGTTNELRRYQAETEEAFNRGLAALRAQIEDEARAKGALNKEKGDLQNQNLQLQACINDLNGQLQACRDQCKNLENTLARERENAQCNMQNLERRMRELQDTMMAKMKECSSARDAQVALKTEIDAYKLLLEEEERRLNNATNSAVPGQMSVNTKSPSPMPPIARPAFSARSHRVTTSHPNNECVNLGNISRAYNPYVTEYKTSYMSTANNPYSSINSLPVKRISAEFTPSTVASADRRMTLRTAPIKKRKPSFIYELDR